MNYLINFLLKNYPDYLNHDILKNSNKYLLELKNKGFLNINIGNSLLRLTFNKSKISAYENNL